MTPGALLISLLATNEMENSKLAQNYTMAFWRFELSQLVHGPAPRRGFELAMADFNCSRHYNGRLSSDLQV